MRIDYAIIIYKKCKILLGFDFTYRRVFIHEIKSLLERR